MRKGPMDHLFAGILLALIVTAPASAAAAPRLQSAVPPPPSLDGHRFVPQPEAPRLPEPAPEAANAPIAATPAPPAANDPLADAAPAEKPAAIPRPAQASGFDIKGTLDKLFAASDAQIAGKLRAIVTARQLDDRIARAADRQAVEAFYRARNYAPLWIHDGRLTARAQDVITRLRDAAADGLDASDYPVPAFDTLSGAEPLADGDIKLTNSVLTFARHLQTGRIAPERVFAQVQYAEHAPQAADILRKITQSADVDAAFDNFNPPDAGFCALKRELASLRARAKAGDTAAPAQNRIPDGPIIKLGVADPRVPLLRERLGLRGRPNDTRYDRSLYNAVRAFQHRHDLQPDGVVGPKVLALVNGTKPPTTVQLIDTVSANMERWRWLPRDLGDTYVMVNIPDFSLKVVHDRRVVWRTDIVVGKPQTPTPLLSASMDSVIVNPSWYVPQSIIQNELLPAYKTDPNIFDRMGLQVEQGPDGHINVVQPPGAANALGRIKFNFPNKFQVYLHDTPEKYLFKYDRRAFSHGCMRVEDPTMFGQVILHLAMNGQSPDSQQIRAMFGQEEHIFRLEQRPKVYLTYQTAFVDDAGKLAVRDDIYGFDARIHAIMHSNERRVADIAPPPDATRDQDTMKSNQEILRRVERREALNPFHFFEKLFR
jgi:L,D-transpeptidase YcbB